MKDEMNEFAVAEQERIRIQFLSGKKHFLKDIIYSCKVVFLLQYDSVMSNLARDAHHNVASYYCYNFSADTNIIIITIYFLRRLIIFQSTNTPGWFGLQATSAVGFFY